MLDISETELPVPMLVGELVSVELVKKVDAFVEPVVELETPLVVCEDVSVIVVLDVEIDESVEEVIPWVVVTSVGDDEDGVKDVDSTVGDSFVEVSVGVLEAKEEVDVKTEVELKVELSVDTSVEELKSKVIVVSILVSVDE